MPAACAVQLASLSEVTVYVFATAGTVTVYGLALLPVTVTGVIPSE